MCPLFLLCLEKFLHVIFGEDRKSMPGDCFSVLEILILHRFDLALHASLMMIYLYSMFLLFLITKKKGEKMQGILFFLFLAYQILHVFLPDILVHYALIDYAFT
jgi:hypothetical protein